MQEDVARIKAIAQAKAGTHERPCDPPEHLLLLDALLLGGDDAGEHRAGLEAAGGACQLDRLGGIGHQRLTGAVVGERQAPGEPEPSGPSKRLLAWPNT